MPPVSLCGGASVECAWMPSDRHRVNLSIDSFRESLCENLCKMR